MIKASDISGFLGYMKINYNKNFERFYVAGAKRFLLKIKKGRKKEISLKLGSFSELDRQWWYCCPSYNGTPPSSHLCTFRISLAGAIKLLHKEWRRIRSISCWCNNCKSCGLNIALQKWLRTAYKYVCHRESTKQWLDERDKPKPIAVRETKAGRRQRGFFLGCHYKNFSMVCTRPLSWK